MSRFPPRIYEAVFYAIENAAVVVDLNFVIRDANEAAADFLHYEDREHLIGTPISEILVDSTLLETVAGKVVNDERWVEECEVMAYDDQVFFGIASAVPIVIDGETRALVGVFTDLTERRQHLNALKILNRVLRHNIRNDVNVALGHVEELATLVDDEEKRARLETIRSRLSGIVGDADTARQLEQLLSEPSNPVVGTYDLSGALDAALREARATYEHATVTGPDGDGDVQVVGNELVEQVLSDLIENAVVHNDSETPHVDVSVDVNEETVDVHVADDGPGVSPKRRDLIFGREEVSQLHHGDGFSLFVVDQVMKSYGGTVRVESSDSDGAEFTLRFPRPSE